jgi:hypothetical protein
MTNSADQAGAAEQELKKCYSVRLYTRSVKLQPTSWNLLPRQAHKDLGMKCAYCGTTSLDIIVDYADR